MKSDILIISDVLVEPPSETFAFRTVTMICHENLELNILFHTTQELKDLYYKWMRPLGLMDYVDYILNEREFEEGIRLDIERFYPNVIVIKWIRLENQISLIGQIERIANGYNDSPIVF